MLTEDQKNHYHSQGYLVLEKAIPKEDIERLRAAALEIVDHFDIDNNRTVFKTSDRDSGRDDYFFNSAENIHCFLEEDALDEERNLLKPVHLAINKIGHAMHDLNPAIKAFCRLPLFGQVLRDIAYQNLSQLSRHAFTLHVAEKSATWSGQNWLQRPALGDFEL